MTDTPEHDWTKGLEPHRPGGDVEDTRELPVNAHSSYAEGELPPIAPPTAPQRTTSAYYGFAAGGLAVGLAWATIALNPFHIGGGGDTQNEKPLAARGATMSLDARGGGGEGAAAKSSASADENAWVRRIRKADALLQESPQYREKRGEALKQLDDLSEKYTGGAVDANTVLGAVAGVAGAVDDAPASWSHSS